MNDIIKWRRWFHSHPELSFSEVETSHFIVTLLDEWGVKWKRWGKTGLTAEIGEGRPVIGVRTDMDALPIEEENEVPYRSQNPGKMHACGHDGHMAILLGLVREIQKQKDLLSGKVVFIFQPAEEVGEGAKSMVNEGMMEYYHIDRIIGFHLFSSVPSGKIAAKPGIIMAEGDRFLIRLRAKGAHGATPWLSKDVVAMGTGLVQLLFSNLSRRISPITDQVVVSVGKISAGTAFNVIPNQMEIEGTIRSLSRIGREKFIEELKGASQGIVESLGGELEMDIERVFPPVVNDKGLYEILKEATLESEFEFQEALPTTISEDFSFFSEKVPGLYFFIGIHNEEKGIVYPHHHPRFNIDEDVLLPSVKLLKNLIDKILVGR